MKINRIAPICLAVTALTSYGQTTTKLTATKADDYGLIYSLPTTVLDITIEAEHTIEKPGQYFKYAKKYLNIDNPVTDIKENWRVKSVSVNARGVENNNERYIMQFKPGGVTYVILNEANLPVAINREDVKADETPVLPLPVEAAPTPLETSAAKQVMTEEMLRSQSIAKKAELAAQQIYDLRSSRNELITGQADQMPPDGKAMQIVMDQISAQEAALTAMFVGTKSVSTDVQTFTFTPKQDSEKCVIARISAIDGIVASDDLSGDPVTLKLHVTERGRLPLTEKGVPKEMPKGGVAYCIPGTASISIEYDGEVFWEGSIDAAQYGVVFGLDPKLFTDKKSPAYLILDPTTGGIKELGTQE
ncbi:MAG: DUF4831 family protein [Muribaculum sp.]|nr:DUF4831 family protein [Muribaculaceae bacterium]MCM1080947.1 DUF4831 family protein [Muribaculum sp.]